MISFNNMIKKVWKKYHNFLSVIAGLMGHYVDGINKGDLPSVETTMTAVIKRENEELVGKSVDHYRKHLSMRIQLPFETITDLEKVDKVLRQECEDLFSKRCFGNEKVRKGFLSSMEVYKHDFLFFTKLSITAKCTSTLSQTAQSLLIDKSYKVSSPDILYGYSYCIG